MFFAQGGFAFEPRDLSGLPRAFTTRRIPDSALVGLDRSPSAPPAAGDLVLARVGELGQHTRLQRPSGRRKILFPGDHIVVAYGDRYAPRQFEAVVPPDLRPCQLIAAGGLAGRVLSWHERITRGATELTPLGLATDMHGERVNLAKWGLPPAPAVAAPRPLTFAVLGSSMNSGKTTTAAFLARGLCRAGMRVGFAKITGSGAGNDLWMLDDAGVELVLDFTDAGYGSTYRLAHDEVEEILTLLTGHLRAARLDVAILEVADGLLQPETAELLRCEVFRSAIDAVLFSSGDALGAVAGAQICRRQGLPLLGLTGVLTAAPLQQREASAATGLPVYDRVELASPITATKLAEEARG